MLSCGNVQQFGQCDCVSFSDVQDESALNSEVPQGTRGKLECWIYDHEEKVAE